jgi:hypothetical protein
MKCALDEQSYRQFAAGLEKAIAGSHKCAVLGIFDANPPFGYSVGLTDQGWPELIIAGLQAGAACTIINNMVTYFGEHGVPDPYVHIDKIVHDFPVRLQPVSDEVLDEYMHQAVQRQIRAGGQSPWGMQIVYPDPEGRWPDDPECEAKTVHAQMLVTDEQRESVQ